MRTSRSECPGNARVSRVGFAVPARQSFFGASLFLVGVDLEVREGEDAFASTRNACATRGCGLA
jgi:hypothetical protein